MNHKMLSAAGCLFLLAAAMVPTALGHDDNLTRAGDVDAGVAGTFYGTAGYYVSFNGQTQNLPDPVGPVDPDFLSAAGSMLCDMEVLGDGTSPQEPDEGRVDGEKYSGNMVKDGTFDDGGQGGVCHTNHYDFDHSGPDYEYNTPGCVDDGAKANNVAPLAPPWVGAACDWKTVEGGTPASDIFTGCLINGIIDGVNDQPGEAVNCVLAFVDCTANPLTCASDGTESCGGDSTADGINFGVGSSRTPYPYAIPAGNSFTNDGLSCVQTDATMSAFMFSGVSVTLVGTTLTHKENPAVQGDVWQVA
ncbi:MAG: hypothetical protein ACYC2H_08975 [Thermoplasmatota archaeon]